jgi:hypothetical protein
MEEAIPKIISGGQTGADRAALDWALSRKLPVAAGAPAGVDFDLLSPADRMERAR